MGIYMERDVSVYKARLEDKFQPVPETGCWIWTGGTNGGGYGAAYFHGKQIPAHRLSYMLYRGEIPVGMELDHLCRVRCCVNPDHLEPVSTRENLRRGMGWSGRNARKTHCAQGHEFTPDNTYWSPIGRHCRTCRKVAWTKWSHSKQQKGNVS